MITSHIFFKNRTSKKINISTIKFFSFKIKIMQIPSNFKQ